MTYSISPSDKLLLLAARWQAFALMATTLARMILRRELSGLRGNLEKAELLETAICAGLVMLNQQIQTAHSERAAHTPEMESALRDMRVYAVILLMLAVYLQSRKACLRSGGDVWAMAGNMRLAAKAPAEIRATAPAACPPYLDSS